MNDSLFFDFTVDKAAKTVYITREFDADLDLVWDAFTKAELLDQWTAPAPMVAKTKYQQFEVGGKRFWAMIGPDGTERWGLQRYTSITPKSNFKLFNTFADADETPEPAGSDWDYTFSAEGDVTKVHIVIYNESFERMERILEGFKLGFTASLGNLEQLLASLKQ
ncbi:MAG: SRPBCC domain-containing protein [Proteobacteria bacterium]|nr:MAG: SRPBCC domain-containing protein [Pseudomonadota bacterium]